MVTLKCIAYLTKTVAKVVVNNLHSSPFPIKINTLMAAENAELNTSLFMEEVQKYPAIYNKFSKDYKNKFIRMNI